MDAPFLWNDLEVQASNDVPPPDEASLHSTIGSATSTDTINPSLLLHFAGNDLAAHRLSLAEALGLTGHWDSQGPVGSTTLISESQDDSVEYSDPMEVDGEPHDLDQDLQQSNDEAIELPNQHSRQQAAVESIMPDGPLVSNDHSNVRTERIDSGAGSQMGTSPTIPTVTASPPTPSQPSSSDRNPLPKIAQPIAERSDANPAKKPDFAWRHDIKYKRCLYMLTNEYGLEGRQRADIFNHIFQEDLRAIGRGEGLKVNVLGSQYNEYHLGRGNFWDISKDKNPDEAEEEAREEMRRLIVSARAALRI